MFMPGGICDVVPGTCQYQLGYVAPGNMVDIFGWQVNSLLEVDWLAALFSLSSWFGKLAGTTCIYKFSPPAKLPYFHNIEVTNHICSHLVYLFCEYSYSKSQAVRTPVRGLL